MSRSFYFLNLRGTWEACLPGERCLLLGDEPGLEATSAWCTVFTVRTQTLAQRCSPSEHAQPPDVQGPFRSMLSVVSLLSF